MGKNGADAHVRARILQTVDELRDEILATSRHLYAHPELSGEEHESSKRLAAAAERAGFTVRTGVAGMPTAFEAYMKPETEGRRIAYLAEYDALPVVGHGCGHNMIGTASTYAAIALASAIGQMDGDVALFGTPAEETDGGKITMLDAGVFHGVTAAMMIHPGMHTEIDYRSLACTGFYIEYFGRAAHAAAAPWKGINALDAMIQLFVAAEHVRKQVDPAARIAGIILHGGDRVNVVPEYTKAQFSIRGTDIAQAASVRERVLACAHSVAESMRVKMKVTADGHDYMDMCPDPELCAIFQQNWQAMGGEVPVTTQMPHGSLDMGNLSRRFPCVHASVRIVEDEAMAGHSREFAEATLTPFAEEQLLRAVRTLALSGADYLCG